MMKNEHWGGRGDGWEYFCQGTANQQPRNLDELLPGDQELTGFQSQTWLLSFLL